MEIVDGEVHWYAFAHGQRVAERTSTGDVVWYVQDHLGSTRLILLETETKQTDLDYTPWGMATATWGSTSDTQYRFNGNTEDVDGVVYYEARSYAVRWGAMMSADTVVPSHAQTAVPEQIRLRRESSSVVGRSVWTQWSALDRELRFRWSRRNDVRPIESHGWDLRLASVGPECECWHRRQ